MAEPRLGYQQVFDVRAALIASIVATIVFALTMMGLDARFSGSPWVTTRAAASVLAGNEVFSNMTVFDLAAFAQGWVVYALLGLLFGFVLTLLLHRFGLVAGLIGGGVLGFSLYVLLYYVLLRQVPLPGVSSLARWTLEVGHVVFGIVVGGVYEWLERARYIKRAGGY